MPRRQHWPGIVVTLATCAAGSGCDFADSTRAVIPTQPGIVDRPLVTTRFAGVVLDEHDVPLEGVRIGSGTQWVETDALGAFSFSVDADGPLTVAPITAVKEGFDFTVNRVRTHTDGTPTVIRLLRMPVIPLDMPTEVTLYDDGSRCGPFSEFSCRRIRVDASPPGQLLLRVLPPSQAGFFSGGDSNDFVQAEVTVAPNALSAVVLTVGAERERNAVLLATQQR